MKLLEKPQSANNSNKQTKRLEVIDMIRGITILMVVAGHVASTPAWLNDLLKDFRMPIFFLVSGYLFSASKYFYNLKLLIKTRFYSLVVPYFSSGILIYLFWLVLQIMKNNQGLEYIWYKPLIAIFYGIQPGGWLINIPIWFLNCLFVTQIIFCIIMRYINRFDWRVQLTSIITLSLAGYFISKLIFIPWNLDVALVAQLFVFVGFKIKELKIIDRLMTIDLISIILLLLFAVTAHFNSIVDMSNRMYGNILLFYIGGIAGSILVIQLTNILYKVKVAVNLLTFVGKESLVILIFHYGFFILALNVFEKHVFFTELNWFITTVIAVGGSLLFNIIIKKIPLLNFFLNGNKENTRANKDPRQKEARVSTGSYITTTGS